MYSQTLPWFVVLGLMGASLAYAVYRIRSMAADLREAQDNFVKLDHEHGILQERLTALESERNRERESAAKQIDTLQAERTAAQQSLEDIRQEKSAIETRIAALQSRTDEERRAFEEQQRLMKESFEASLQEKQQQIEDLIKERDDLRTQLDKALQEKSNLETDLAALHTESRERLQAADEKIQLLEEAEKKLTSEFENLANRIFEEKHKKFYEVSKTSVEALLNPMQQQLTDFRKKVEEVYDQENRERASLRTEINSLKSLNERISADALNLTRALKGNSKTRGNWGEMQLERLLEESGLAKGREFEVQKSLKNEEGKRLQPDVVIHLPEQKDVIIDSKVSLVAYEQYHSADDEAREQYLRQHIASLRKHFKDLSGKRYDDLIGVNSLDLVIMFVPIEPALMLAFEHEPTLFNEAFNLGILLVSPSTLMATLQIIHNIWRYEYQNRNVQKIADEAGRLHDQFVLFVEALEKVGHYIRKAGDSFETAHKRLTSGRGNLVGRTHKLQVLGAKNKKNIARKLLEAAAVENDELETALLTNKQEKEDVNQ